jgi:hypothetical protein
LVIEELKSHKSPGIGSIPAEMIRAGGRKIRYEIHKLIISIWYKEELPAGGRRRSSYLCIRRAIKQIIVIIEAYHFCQLHTNVYPTSCCQGKIHIQRKYLVIINVEFVTTGQLQIIHSAFIKYFRRDGNTMKQCISSLQTSRKLMIHLGGRSYILFPFSQVSP